MNYVQLGRTGLHCAAVSFGGIPIQRSDAANTKSVVDALEKCGMNYIDTARGYTVSEEYLGAALEGRRDKFILATKSMARDYAGMKQDVEISLGNLRTDYIDIYQLHNLPGKDFDRFLGRRELTGPWRRRRRRERSATSGPPPTAWMPCAYWWRTTLTVSKR